MAASRRRRSYDHRLREITVQEGDPALFAGLGIPVSTARSWIRRGARPVVTLDVDPGPAARSDVARKLQELEQRNRLLVHLLRLLFALLRALSANLDEARVVEGAAKASLLAAVEKATAAMPLAVALRMIGLSESRYHAWKQRERLCLLPDQSSCPRTIPTQLTAQEVSVMKEMVLDKELRHMPVSALALHAQRLGKLFASPTTWWRLIRERGWERPRRRVYPDHPEIGIRATAADQFWHVDVTKVRLLDGTTLHLHAVIDNYSRRILAWCAASTLLCANTVKILIEAGAHLTASQLSPTVLMDSGVENLNHAVDDLFSDGRLHRVLAQVDVLFSNSMVEAWWQGLKSRWLYINPLTNFAEAVRLISFYVQQHNSVMPHSAFLGQTPDEMYFGTGEGVPEALAAARQVARAARMAQNRLVQCPACGPPAEAPARPVSGDPLVSSGVQLHAPDSRIF